MTPEEALDKPVNKSIYKEIYKNIKNPYNIPYQMFLFRIRSGMTPEEAMHKEPRGTKKEFYKNNNKFNVPFNSYCARLNVGETMEEALSRPLKKDIFPSGDLFVEHNGEYLKISELGPIFTLDRCKQLYKSGIKLEKLFKNIN